MYYDDPEMSHIFNVVMAITTCSRRFQFSHNNFNLLTASSFCWLELRQFVQFGQQLAATTRFRSTPQFCRRQPCNILHVPKLEHQNWKHAYLVVFLCIIPILFWLVVVFITFKNVLKRGISFSITIVHPATIQKHLNLA